MGQHQIRETVQSVPPRYRNLVESATLYAIFLLLDIVFTARRDITLNYTDLMAGFARVQ